MVKREKSPEITEDILLFAVWNPYPVNPNWVFDEDVQECAKWVAEVIGNQYHLFSIHRKPSSRGMILLEISKEFTQHGRLLGEHQWRYFLKSPKEQENHSTCVYYSIYRTCREASKDGWRPKSIETKWFNGWSPGIGPIVFPYPESRYCLPPPEDKTNKQICRYIPSAIKPLPKASELESFVESQPWLGGQTENNDLTAGTSRIDVKSPDSLEASIVEPSTLAVQSSDSLVTQSKPKPKVIPLRQFRSQTEIPQKKLQALGSAWARSTSTVPKPPILQQAPAKPQNAWVKPPKLMAEKSPKISIMPDSADSWKASHEPWSAVCKDEKIPGTSDTRQDTSSYAEQASSSSSFHMTAMANNLNEAKNPQKSSYTTLDFSEEECSIEDVLSPLEAVINDEDIGTKFSDKHSENRDWSKEWSDPEEESKKKPDIVCPTHGIACAKRICKDYKKLEWNQKREKNGQLRGRGRGRGRGQRSRAF